MSHFAFSYSPWMTETDLTTGMRTRGFLPLKHWQPDSRSVTQTRFGEQSAHEKVLGGRV